MPLDITHKKPKTNTITCQLIVLKSYPNLNRLGKPVMKKSFGVFVWVTS